LDKADLVDWLKKKHQEWEALIQEIEPAQMEESGVIGFWSLKDVIAHMVGWNIRNVDKIRPTWEPSSI
jgi:hypothetical protein